MHNEKKSDGSTHIESNESVLLGFVRDERRHQQNADGTYSHNNERAIGGFVSEDKSSKRADGSSRELHYQETPFGLLTNSDRKYVLADGSTRQIAKKEVFGNTFTKEERIDAEGNKTTTVSYSAPLGLWNDSSTEEE